MRTTSCPSLGPPHTRVVKQPLRAWQTDLPTETEHIPRGPIAPLGEHVVIEAFEEVLALPWAIASDGQTMALVCWGDALYLVLENDLQERTIRVLRWGGS
jgi:hypothetical protein